MVYFHGQNRKKSYFEGWYFKHQTGDSVIAFIPGYHVTENGEKSAFIQVITPINSFHFVFPAEQFYASRDRLEICIAHNVFSERGLSVDLKNEQFSVQGELKYGDFTPPEQDVMGPFRFAPFLQCNHGVVSLLHRLNGTLQIQGRPVDFCDGTGYIETDWGTSFPKAYLWTQSCRMGSDPFCVMVSIADIPFAGGHFRGCIGCVYYCGKEYRLATYNGVKIRRYEKNHVILTRGEQRLEIRTAPSDAQKLLAPQSGLMSREIHESVSCKVRVRFSVADTLLFDIVSQQAGFEFVG